MIVKSVGIFQSADSWSGVTLATAKGFLNIVISYWKMEQTQIH